MDDDDLPPSSSRASGNNKATVAMLVTMVVVLVVAGIGIATVRDASKTIRQATAATTTVAPAGTPVPPPSDLTPEQSRVVEEVKAQVAAIRGLAWKVSLPVKVLTKDALAQRLRKLTAKKRAENREEVTTDESILKLLKFIGKDVDYAKTIDSVLAGGVLGFYDANAKELFVGGDGSDTLDPATRVTLAHELTHALTDQHFDFGARTKALIDQNRTEEGAALSALIEGDAELVAEQWSERHLSEREQRQAANGGSSGVGAYARAPSYLLESLLFPYQDGLTFVRSRHRAGGFAEVDNAYRRPPTSTEHILHPETYTSQPSWTPPALPDLAQATGCGKVGAGSLGEFDMRNLLAQELSLSEARAAAAGWNGDAFGVVRCGAALGLADRWQTDDPADAGRLAEALSRWARGWSGATRATDDTEGRFTGPSGSGRVVRTGGRVDLVLADDVATADRLARALLAA